MKALLLASALMVSGCGSSDDSTVRIVAIGQSPDPFQSGARLSLAGQLVRSSVAEGLVAFDAEGRVVPAMADRWIVTDDGQSYIFRLRDAAWRGGEPITANAAKAALEQAVRSLRGTALGLDLRGIIEIRTMAGRVVEVRLARPMPHFLHLLAQPELGLLQGGKGTGPMRLRRDKDIATLRMIPPENRGQPAIADWLERVRPVQVQALSGDKAVAAFNAGDADLLLGGRIESFPLASSVGLLRGTIQLDPVMGLFGLAVLHQDGFLSAPENREAIALAVDRDAMFSAFGVGGWEPSTRIVAKDAEDDSGTIGERWTGLGLDERRQAARARVLRWRGSAGQSVRLRIALPRGPGADLLFDRLQQDFAAIGIQSVRTGPNAAADLALIDEIARYPRGAWFLNRFNCKVARGACSREADDQMELAQTARDDEERSTFLANAEAKLTVANVFIPFGAPIRWSLVRGDAKGFAANRLGWHPLMPVAFNPK